MNRICSITCLLLALYATCYSQSNQVEQKMVKATGLNYKDFIIAGDSLWTLDERGELHIFSIHTGEMLSNPTGDTAEIFLIVKDRKGQVIIGDASQHIKSYDKITHTWTALGSFDGLLLGITFDNHNRIFLITDKGIRALYSRQTFFPLHSLNGQIKYARSWFKKPAYMVDSGDNIWIGFGYGEWGGDLIVYSITQKEFIQPQAKKAMLELSPVKSIFQGDSGLVYISTGLAHMDVSGSIVRFSNFVAQPVIESRPNWDPGDKDSGVEAEYIGPALFNPSNHCIYFYSQHGIFKGNPANDLSTIEKWEKITTPRLHWSHGQPDAVGSPMNVLKMELADDGSLVFVTQLDGIGILKGRTLLLVK